MQFRGHTALDGVIAALQQDCITGLLGRNGAGKTTLIQLLTGHRIPTSGQVRTPGSGRGTHDSRDPSRAPEIPSA